MKLPIFQVDAFSDRPFRGNPAAVCPLEQWLPDETMQGIAAECNLSNTAFFVTNGEAFHLRWFTPAVEVDLCGHATLATAHVLWNHLGYSRQEIYFDTRGGRITVGQDSGRIVLHFPAWPPQHCAVDENLIPALGHQPLDVLAARDYLVVYGSEKEVRELHPDMHRLTEIDRFGTVVTAPGDSCDFVSRFFAPSKGVPEDPVTGSAHAMLIPYWAERLNRTSLHARQISRRSGDLACRYLGDRVTIAGHAVTFFSGEISLPD